MTEFLVCYDITDARRLGRVHRYLKKCAMPLQYSVFLFTGGDRQLARCLDGIGELIDPRTDDVRAYPLPSRGLKVRVGRPVLPQGIQLASLPGIW